MKLNSEHLLELAALLIWRMQYFSDTASLQQFTNSITSIFVQQLQFESNLFRFTRWVSKLKDRFY